MMDADGARRLYRESTRIGPVRWVFVLGILALVVGHAWVEGDAFTARFFTAFAAAGVASLLAAQVWWAHLVRSAPPDDLRRKAIRRLRAIVSYAKVHLVLGIFSIGCLILGALPLNALAGFLDDSPWGRMSRVPVFLGLMFFYDYFIVVPRARRILESIPMNEGGDGPRSVSSASALSS